jgi:hypothetical protein
VRARHNGLCLTSVFDLIFVSGRAAGTWSCGRLGFRDGMHTGGNHIARLDTSIFLGILVHPFLPLGVHGHPPRLTDARSCSLDILTIPTGPIKTSSHLD